MHVLVTGASGWIGSAVVPALQQAGHQVTGLARSDAAAARVEALGATVARGSIDDPEGLAALAAGVDGVVHLAYHHDFSQMAEAAAIDRRVIEAFGEVLRGTGGPLVIASGTLGLAPGRVGTERDRPDAATHPRIANAEVALGLADQGVRSVVVRFAPTVHGEGDLGFVATLARIAREKGVAGYVGEGANRWPAVHRLDAGDLVARAVDRAPARTVLHAVAETGVTTREIAQALGSAIGVPAASIAPEDAADHFGWMSAFIGFDCPVSNDLTRDLLDWSPTGPTLLADIAAGHYPGTASHS